MHRKKVVHASVFYHFIIFVLLPSTSSLVFKNDGIRFRVSYSGTSVDVYNTIQICCLQM
jgi:hypothetical protein